MLYEAGGERPALWFQDTGYKKSQLGVTHFRGANAESILRVSTCLHTNMHALPTQQGKVDSFIYVYIERLSPPMTTRDPESCRQGRNGPFSDASYKNRNGGRHVHTKYEDRN